MPTLDIELEEGENHIVYYLIKEDNTTVSEQRTKILYLDTKAPQINGLEEGKVYCEAVTFSVVEENLDLASSSIPESVSQNSDGSFTASPAAGVQEIVLRDKAGNETSVHITVNGTHTFEDGVCVHCGASDPNYKAPAVQSNDVPDAVPTTPDAAGNWYRKNTIKLTAPTGYYISQTSDESSFGTATSLDLTLNEGENKITYYLSLIHI